MKKLHVVSGLLAAVLLPLSFQCFAQAASISDCQAIQDRLARYACYDSWDAASGTIRQAAPRANSSARVVQQEEEEPSLLGRIFNGDEDEAEPAQVATESTAESELENFGRAQPATRLTGGLDGKSELIGSIASLEQAGPSMWLVTLEGGQQWKQMLSKRYSLQVGEEVRIYPTRWGNAFRLSSSRLGSYIQVARVGTGNAVPVAETTSAPQVEQAQVQQEEEEEGRSLLGRLGGIFDRDDGGDDEEQAAQEPPAQVATASNAESELENFGRAQPSTRIVDGLEGKSELIDSVASLEQAGPSMWLITLEGGQRWKQMLSKRYTLQVGEEVRIYPTRWGNAFRLSSKRLGGYIQVERVD